MTRRNFLGCFFALALTRPARALLVRQTVNEDNVWLFGASSGENWYDSGTPELTGWDLARQPDYMVQIVRKSIYGDEYRVIDQTGGYQDAHVRFMYDGSHEDAIGIVKEYRIPREVWRLQQERNRAESMLLEQIIVKKKEEFRGIEVVMDLEANAFPEPSGPAWDAAVRETAKHWADIFDEELAKMAYGGQTSRYVDSQTGIEYYYAPRKTWT